MALDGKKWRRAIGLAREVTWGTHVAATHQIRAWGDETITMKPNYIELGGTEETRAKIDLVFASKVLEGSIPDVEVIHDVVPLLFESAMGTKVGNLYTLKDGKLPSLSLERIVGGQGFFIDGVKINGMTLDLANNEIFKASFDIVGKNMYAVDDAQLANPAYSDAVPFVFYQGTFKVDDVEEPILSASISLTNNLRHPLMETGSAYSQEQNEGVREVTGNFVTRLTSLAHWQALQNRSTAKLELLFSDGAHTLTIEIPKAYFPDYDWAKGDQDIDQTINFTAVKTDTKNEMEITIT